MNPQGPSEYEKTGQTTAGLSSQRRRLMARLAAERAELLWQILGADEGALCELIIIESWNRAHAEARLDEPWEDVWTDLHTVRDRFHSILEEMSDQALKQVYRFPWGSGGTAYQWARVLIDHDREHADGLRAAMRVHAGRNASS